MKLSANESNDVTAKVTSQFKLWVLLPGVKQPKKISVTYHFVISAMQAFVCIKFHAIF